MRFMVSVQSADPNPSVRSLVSRMVCVTDNPVEAVGALYASIMDDLREARKNWAQFTRAGVPAHTLDTVITKTEELSRAVAVFPYQDLRNMGKVVFLLHDEEARPVTNKYMVDRLPDLSA